MLWTCVLDIAISCQTVAFGSQHAVIKCNCQCDLRVQSNYTSRAAGGAHSRIAKLLSSTVNISLLNAAEAVGMS